MAWSYNLVCHDGNASAPPQKGPKSINLKRFFVSGGFGAAEDGPAPAEGFQDRKEFQLLTNANVPLMNRLAGFIHEGEAFLPQKNTKKHKGGMLFFVYPCDLLWLSKPVRD